MIIMIVKIAPGPGEPDFTSPGRNGSPLALFAGDSFPSGMGMQVVFIMTALVVSNDLLQGVSFCFSP